jgi:hypothetical protein
MAIALLLLPTLFCCMVTFRDAGVMVFGQSTEVTACCCHSEMILFSLSWY